MNSWVIYIEHMSRSYITFQGLYFVLRGMYHVAFKTQRFLVAKPNHVEMSHVPNI